ncbi:MAG: GGDEF domain-containing protein [Acidobacteriia bacterium]|nr:GGDEF domain-containing protein [Terriglobia bacterium]
MNSAPARTLVSFVVPGGALLLAALVLAQVPEAHATAPAVVNFLLWAAMFGALTMAWRFHSSRALFAAIVLCLGERALAMLGHASPPAANAGFALLALLLPLNLVFFSVIGECGLTLTSVGSGLGILSMQAVGVVVLARPENLEFARWAERAYLPPGLFAWTPLPQLALLTFAAAAAWLGMRMTLLRKPVDWAFFWSVWAAFAGLHAASPGRASSLYLATGVLMFAAALVETSYLLAFHDELTGLPGRRAFNQALLTLRDTYSIAMVDVDHFKKFNDTYGHDTGDQVLRMVAAPLAQVSGGGRAFRYGGEEFAIVFAGQRAAQCLEHLEGLRAAIERSTFMVRGPDRSQRRRDERRYAQPGRRPVGSAKTRTAVTVSIGVAEATARSSAPELVIEAADQALYRAKNNGRNRVEAAVKAKHAAQPTAVGAR